MIDITMIIYTVYIDTLQCLLMGYPLDCWFTDCEKCDTG